jgi:hypothetical protein
MRMVSGSGGQSKVESEELKVPRVVTGTGSAGCVSSICITTGLIS